MAGELNIFYADDDPDDLDFFRDVAGTINRPLRLSVYEQGDKLIEALHGADPQNEIVFLDLNLPGKDGFDILSEIRHCKDLEKVPVVILSTTSDAKSVEKCLKSGANFFVQKSSSFTGLRKSIEDAISIDYTKFRPSKNNFLYKEGSVRRAMF